MDQTPNPSLTSLLSANDLEILIQSVVQRTLCEILPHIQSSQSSQSSQSGQGGQSQSGQGDPTVTIPTPPDSPETITLANTNPCSQSPTPDISQTPWPIGTALLEEAIAASSQGAVTHLLEVTLQNYINHCKRLEVFQLLGTIDYAENHDYKQQRCRCLFSLC
jgi:hypothetical protein